MESEEQFQILETSENMMKAKPFNKYCVILRNKLRQIFIVYYQGSAKYSQTT
jgi:hypothetical protein